MCTLEIEQRHLLTFADPVHLYSLDVMHSCSVPLLGAHLTVRQRAPRRTMFFLGEGV